MEHKLFAFFVKVPDMIFCSFYNRKYGSIFRDRSIFTIFGNFAVFNVDIYKLSLILSAASFS